jgi:hypothetical protein
MRARFPGTANGKYMLIMLAAVDLLHDPQLSNPW